MRNSGKGEMRRRAVITLMFATAATAVGGLAFPGWALLCWVVSIVLAATGALLIMSREDQ